MTNERKIELFDEIIDHIWEQNQEYGIGAYVEALRNIGYTKEEITEELISCNFDDEHIDDKCPLGGDISNDCADCAYGCDYHYINGECIDRKEEEFNDYSKASN